jgi:hypothetical protein
VQRQISPLGVAGIAAAPSVTAISSKEELQVGTLLGGGSWSHQLPTGVVL